MKEYKVEVDVRAIKQGREVKIKVSVPLEKEVGYFRICPAGEVRQAILDTINVAFGEILEQ